MMTKLTITKNETKDKLITAAGIACGVGFVAALGAFWYGTRVESRRYKIEVERIKIGSNNGKAAKAKKPLRILHISDLHLCYPESHKIEFLRRVTASDYDLVFLTGDIFENLSGLSYAQSILAKPPRLGAYAVLGNHDYYDYNMFHKVFGRIVRKFRHPEKMRDVTPLVACLERSGFHVLRNQAVKLPEHQLHIVGIDYPGIAKHKLDELVEQAEDEDSVLVLFHLPRNLQHIADSGAHLAVGGHTHGGQIRIPGYGAIITDSEVPRSQASGVFWKENTAFHISRGVGADPRTNIRLFCPPHATIIELHR